MLSNLREAINRNPGFEKELVAQTTKIMEYSGMSNFMKLQASLKDAKQKEQDALNGIYVAAIKEAGLDPADYGGSIQLAGQAASKIIQERKGVSDTLQKLKVLTETNQLTREIVDKIVASPGWQASQQTAYTMLHSTLQNNLSSGAYRTSKQQGMTDVDADLIGVTKDIQAQRRLITSMVAQGSAASKPALDDYMKQLDTMEALYKDIITGKYNATEKENKLKALEASVKLPFATGMVQLNYMNQITSSLEHLRNATGQFPNIDKNLTDGISNYLTAQMRFLQGMGPAPLANVDTSNKSGQNVANFAMSLTIPEKAIGMTRAQVVTMNSGNITNVLKSIDSITDKDQYSKMTDILVANVNSLTDAEGKPASINKIISPESAQQLASHLERSLGNVARSGVIDYNAATNSFNIVNESGAIQPAATDKFNKMFKALQSIKGVTEDADVDKYGTAIVDMSKRMTQPAGTSVQQTDGKVSPGFTIKLAPGEKLTAERLKAEVNAGNITIQQADEIAMKEGIDLSYGTTPAVARPETAPDNTVPTLSEEQKRFLNQPQQPQSQQRGVSPQFVKDLKAGPKQQIDVKEQSRNILLGDLRKVMEGQMKSSPLLKRDPMEDAIESVSYLEPLYDIPGAGPAIEAAMVAFGLTNAIPTLAKKLPRLFKAGDVVPTMSNVTVAGGNASASRMTAQSMMREAKKAEVAKAKELYQEYWKKEWIKQRVDLPKSDLEWSNAIAEANKWVASRMDKAQLKSMGK